MSRRQEMIKMCFSNEAVSDGLLHFSCLLSRTFPIFPSRVCVPKDGCLLSAQPACLCRPLDSSQLRLPPTSIYQVFLCMCCMTPAIYRSHLSSSLQPITIQHLACSLRLRPPDMAGQLRSTSLPYLKEITKGI